MRKSIVEDQVMVAAPAELVRQLICDVTSWPQWYRPAVHAEFLEPDLIQHWMLVDDHSAQTWRERRRLSDDGTQVIAVREVGGAPDVTTWTVEEQPYGKTALRVRVEVSAGSREADEAIADGCREFLDAVRDRAERAEELDRLVISFEDPLFVSGGLEDCYDYLFEADKWPERVPHVLALDMEQPSPTVQFFDMDTRSADGSEHTTRSVRICLSGSKIVYKQIKPPATMDAHTGHWTFTETPEGILLGARHTCTIRPEGLHLLGEGTTVEGARRYLRKVLSANSMGNLRLTKEYAEERAR